VLTAGGASVGDHDVIRPAFERIGGKIDFWKVAIRPGKPFFFGRLGEKYLFGVPGNPVSAFVTTVLLVLPALRRLQGASDAGPHSVFGTLAVPISNTGDRRHFIRIATSPDGSVRPAGVQASHILSSLALADGFVDLPPRSDLPAGTPVRVIRW
jgi:molybdopterin molybdotransferase